MLYNLSITKIFSAKNSAFKSDIYSLKSSWTMSDEFDKTAFLHVLQSIPRVHADRHCLPYPLAEFYCLKYELPLNVGLLIILFLCTIEAI